MRGGKHRPFKNAAQAQKIAHRCRTAGKELKRSSGVSSEEDHNLIELRSKTSTLWKAAGEMGRQLEDKSWERESSKPGV
ncbi:MAG TPA: hypothetical protein VF089_06945 [Candidatus Binatia bacterium]